MTTLARARLLDEINEYHAEMKRFEVLGITEAAKLMRERCDLLQRKIDVYDREGLWS